MIGEHARHPVRSVERGTRDPRPRAVRADHAARGDAMFAPAAGVGVYDDRAALGIALDPDEGAGAAFGTGGGGTRAEPFVERVAIDHPDKAFAARIDGISTARSDGPIIRAASARPTIRWSGIAKSL